MLGQLRQSYSFAARTFGQGVSADEIAAFIQGVPGVIACNVKSLTLGPTSKAAISAAPAGPTYAYQQWLIAAGDARPPGPEFADAHLRLSARRRAWTSCLIPPRFSCSIPIPKSVVLGVLA